MSTNKIIWPLNKIEWLFNPFYFIKWPIHVIDYNEPELSTNKIIWPFNKIKRSADIYKIINKHFDPIYGNITVLINKETYEPYSHMKSARN